MLGEGGLVLDKFTVTLECKVPPPMVALVAAAVSWALARWTSAWTVGGTWLPVASWCLAGAGVGIGLWSLWYFRRAGTTFDPHVPQRTRVFVEAGPYRYSRNPMYLGLACLLLAWCARLAHPLALVGVALFVAYISRFQIAPEERVLREKFGEAYLRYCARVRRWL
ncbi:MAG: isoprenylcysteine carboxylmethyltransferase family protein [Burkholderiales bacterium]|nr:isoprenylcysteine carboxylmethyltransferase family protein [Burkholderiales bacterium]